MGVGLTAQRKAMKKFLLFLLLVCPVLVKAQELVNFNLTSEATFVNPEGENFEIVPFEGKSAHQIYQTLAMNIGTLYNDPSKVMSGVDDASIKIRAYCDNLYNQSVLGISHCWQGYYQLEFRIKDGRVRVSAPIIENDIKCPSLSSNAIGGNTGNFAYVVKKWFKNGKLKEKDAPKAINLENQMNALINAILGLTGPTSTANEDW